MMPRPRFSLIMLTYNRPEILARTMAHNLTNAGCTLDELIWVDNGSDEPVHAVMRKYRPEVSILNRVNLGVSKGFNRGIAVATGDYLVFTEDDMLMPDKWLLTFRTYLLAIPNTGVACMFPDDPRYVFTRTIYHLGLGFHPCIPWSRRLVVPRDLLISRIGYLREDFGLFGSQDLEWGHRAARLCRREGLLTYAIAGPRPIHIGTEEHDSAECREIKREARGDPGKRILLERCASDGLPYYNPYC
jgi:glycosyltransferase involved in cell wall biosynthesis